MPRGPNEKAITACELYKSGRKLIEIAKELGVPDGTVRRWKSTYAWDGERKSERSEKKKANVRKGEKKKPIAKEVMDVIQNTKLTDKQRLFCIYCIRCFNATKAYQRAYGCKYDVANAEGYKLLVHPCVREEILRLKQNSLNRKFFSEEDLFQKYMDIACADITEFVEFGSTDISLMGAEKREFLNHHQFDDSSKNATVIYLWTEKGAFLHAKSLNTDIAWEVYDKLVDNYFKRQDILDDLSLELRAIIVVDKRITKVEEKVEHLE